MSAARVKTRLLIISDTHCAPLLQNNPIASPFRLPLPAADVLVHCGDLTRTGKIEQYHAALDMLREIDAPVKLVIAGNHDKTLDRDYVVSHAAQNQKTSEEAAEEARAARDLWTSPSGRAVQEGVRFLAEGSHRVQLSNGASLLIYASPYTPEFYDWAFPYERDEDRFNTPTSTLSDAKNIAPYPIPSYSTTKHPVDLLITHGPPWGRLDQTFRGDKAGCPHALRALMRARPLVHCFGHIHEGWGAEKIRWAKTKVVDELVRQPCTTKDWTEAKWKWSHAKWRDGVSKIEPIKVDADEVQERHAVFVDVSGDGDKPLVPGQESLLVNASIMDVKYRPSNAPWVVDIDLPKSKVAPNEPLEGSVARESVT